MVVISVEVNAAVLDLLVRTRWLGEREAGERVAIGRAIGRLLADAAKS
jgi:hypothetical protein